MSILHEFFFFQTFQTVLVFSFVTIVFIHGIEENWSKGGIIDSVIKNDTTDLETTSSLFGNQSEFVRGLSNLIERLRGSKGNSPIVKGSSPLSNRFGELRNGSLSERFREIDNLREQEFRKQNERFKELMERFRNRTASMFERRTLSDSVIKNATTDLETTSSLFGNRGLSNLIERLRGSKGNTHIVKGSSPRTKGFVEFRTGNRGSKGNTPIVKGSRRRSRGRVKIRTGNRRSKGNTRIVKGSSPRSKGFEEFRTGNRSERFREIQNLFREIGSRREQEFGKRNEGLKELIERFRNRSASLAPMLERSALSESPGHLIPKFNLSSIVKGSSPLSKGFGELGMGSLSDRLKELMEGVGNRTASLASMFERSGLSGSLGHLIPKLNQG